MYLILVSMLDNASPGAILSLCLVVALAITIFVYHMLLSDSEEEREKLSVELKRYRDDNWDYQRRLQNAMRDQYFADKQITQLSEQLLTNQYKRAN